MIGVLVEKAQDIRFGNVVVTDSIQDLTDFDAIIFTALGQSGEYIDALRKGLDKGRIFVPPILGMSTNNRLEDEEL